MFEASIKPAPLLLPLVILRTWTLFSLNCLVITHQLASPKHKQAPSVLNLVFEALNRISLEVYHRCFNSNRGNLVVQLFLHCYPFVLTSLIEALMLVICLEASCNGETPWEEASDRARGEEEERAGRVFDWTGWAKHTCTKAPGESRPATGEACTRFILFSSPF
jgi:hypothetical protein